MIYICLKKEINWKILLFKGEVKILGNQIIFQLKSQEKCFILRVSNAMAKQESAKVNIYFLIIIFFSTGINNSKSI